MLRLQLVVVNIGKTPLSTVSCPLYGKDFGFWDFSENFLKFFWCKLFMQLSEIMGVYINSGIINKQGFENGYTQRLIGGKYL